MKKPFLFRLGILGLFLISIFSLLYSCQKGNTNKGASPNGLVLDQPARLDDGTILPKGTIISKITGDEHSIKIQLPAGFSYVGYAMTSEHGIPTAQVIKLETVKVTCTCNSGSGCSPFTAGGKVGCTAGNCTNCTMTTSSIANGRSTQIIKGGVIDLNTETHFITTKNELYNTPSAFKAMFDLKAIQDQVKKLEGFQDKNDLSTIEKGIIPVGYQYLPAIIYGREVFVLVKKDLTISSDPDPRVSEVARMFSEETQKITCTCNSGTSGCTAQSADFGQVKYCDAGSCKSCTLSTN